MKKDHPGEQSSYSKDHGGLRDLARQLGIAFKATEPDESELRNLQQLLAEKDEGDRRLSEIELEDPGDALDDEHYQDSLAVQDFHRRLLLRLGFKGSLSIPEWWAAAQSVGFDFGQFYSLPLKSLASVLQAKARALNQANSEYAPHDDLFEAMKDEARTNGGRPVMLTIDGSQIKLLRKERGLKQETLARTCNISVPTLQRAEAGDASAHTIECLARGLSIELERQISAIDLTKSHQ
jgi:DNA-binding transcriptional regulator YiaG